MRPNNQQPRGLNNNPNRIDFDNISDLPSKYPRELLPENLEANMELGGTYQNFIYKLGNCCGNLRLVCPCLFCVEYPYKQIDQSYVGTLCSIPRHLRTVRKIRQDYGFGTAVLQPIYRQDPHRGHEDQHHQPQQAKGAHQR